MPTVTATRSPSGYSRSGSASRLARSASKASRTLKALSSGQRRSDGLALAPEARLGVEVVQVGERARGEEAVAYVADRALDAALLVAARDRHRARLEAVVRGELQQRRVEADRVAHALEHGALEVVVQQDPADPPKATKASTWPRRKLSMRASRKKRRKMRRE